MELAIALLAIGALSLIYWCGTRRKGQTRPVRASGPRPAVPHDIEAPDTPTDPGLDTRRQP